MLAAAMVALVSIPGETQERGVAHPAAFPKGKYAALDALPDWGGVWIGDGPITKEEPQRKGKYLKDYQEQMALRAKGLPIPNPFSNCLPRGMPSMMALGVYPIEFLFTPGRVTSEAGQ
jgi:hypothetical protein